MKINQTTFQIIKIEEEKLGRCYYSTKYEIQSLFPIKDDMLVSLRDSGLLGSGQTFYISRPFDKPQNIDGRWLHIIHVNRTLDSGD